MTIKTTFDIDESISTLLLHIKTYLSAVEPQSLSEIYAEIPKALLQTNVSEVKLENINDLRLNFTSKNLAATLNRKTVSIIGLRISNLLDGINKIQNTDPNTTLQEAIQKTSDAFYKRFSESQLSHAILLYAQLYEKIRLLNPTDSKEEIFARLNNRFHHHFKNTHDGSSELPPAYYDFINAYQKKEAGFFAIFGDEKDDLAPYHITQKLIENSGSELTDYLNIIRTIEKIPTYLQDESGATYLASHLKNLSNEYFSTLFKINISEDTAEAKTNKKLAAFDSFREQSHDSIKIYKEDHSEELNKEKTHYLNKLLWLIEKLVPFISTVIKMTLFGRHTEKTEAAMQLKELSNTIVNTAPAA